MALQAEPAAPPIADACTARAEPPPTQPPTPPQPPTPTQPPPASVLLPASAPPPAPPQQVKDEAAIPTLPSAAAAAAMPPSAMSPSVVPPPILTPSSSPSGVPTALLTPTPSPVAFAAFSPTGWASSNPAVPTDENERKNDMQHEPEGQVLQPKALTLRGPPDHAPCSPGGARDATPPGRRGHRRRQRCGSGAATAPASCRSPSSAVATGLDGGTGAT